MVSFPHILLLFLPAASWPSGLPCPHLRTLPGRALNVCLAANCESSWGRWGRWDPDSEVLWDNEDAVCVGGMERMHRYVYICVYTPVDMCAWGAL